MAGGSSSGVFMASGKTSKAARSSRPVVVRKRSTPWGMIAAVTVVVLFAAGVFGYAFVRNQENQSREEALKPFTPTAENPDPSTRIPGIEIVEYGGGQHVAREVPVAYTKSPPLGGAHDYAWASCNGVVYPQAIRSENLVHSLEHGAVWIAYNPDQVTGDALNTLTAKVQDKPYTVMSPYPGLDQPISVQSWGHQLKLSDPQDIRIDQFITALRVNTNEHPEAGASCGEIGPPQQGSEGFQELAPPPFAPVPAPGTPGSSPEIVEGDGVAPDSAAAGQGQPTTPAGG